METRVGRLFRWSVWTHEGLKSRGRREPTDQSLIYPIEISIRLHAKLTFRNRIRELGGRFLGYLTSQPTTDFCAYDFCLAHFPSRKTYARATTSIYETCCFKCERNVDSYVNMLIQNFPINSYTICTILSPLFQPLHFSFLFFLNKKFNNPKLIRNVDLDIDRESVRRVSRLFVRLLFQFPRDW